MDNSQGTLFLVDATNELHRAYHTAPRAQHNGLEVGATRMFARMLAKLADDALGIMVFIDATETSCWRRDLWSEYKANRRNIVDPAKAREQAEVRSQYTLAFQAAEAMGLTVIRKPGFEGDDGIATAAECFSTSAPQRAGSCDEADDGRFSNTLIVSPDKDLLQCLHGVGSGRVELLDRQRGKTVNVADVVTKYQIWPESIPDWLALVGDTSDGIPGVPGWGEKTASKVLGAFRFVEEIPVDAGAWPPGVRGAAKLSAALEARRADVALWKRLATLRTDVPGVTGASTGKGSGRDFGRWCEQTLGLPAQAVLRPSWRRDDEAPTWPGWQG